MTGNGSLGCFLRERRTRLDPVALGYAGGRRRTKGLRREEVAQRASISTTWYSWLEQGRGGAPSAHTLDRVAEALLLTPAEREHLFLLGLGRPPDVHSRPLSAVSSRLQTVLDALHGCPAIVRNAEWDVVAWNRAALAVLGDYGALPAAERNMLRLMFLDPRARREEIDWEGAARFIVSAFRGDTARTGAAASVASLVDHLCADSADFARMWRQGEINTSCEAVRRLRHDELGTIELDSSAFAVDGRPDLMMIVYTPILGDDLDRVQALAGARGLRVNCSAAP